MSLAVIELLQKRQEFYKAPSAVEEDHAIKEIGGTALALYLAHRKSVDFDLFGSRALDLAQITRRVKTGR
jgi:hypothetical protein